LAADPAGIDRPAACPVAGSWCGGCCATAAGRGTAFVISTILIPSSTHRKSDHRRIVAKRVESARNELCCESLQVVDGFSESIIGHRTRDRLDEPRALVLHTLPEICSPHCSAASPTNTRTTSGPSRIERHCRRHIAPLQQLHSGSRQHFSSAEPSDRNARANKEAGDASVCETFRNRIRYVVTPFTAFRHSVLRMYRPEGPPSAWRRRRWWAEKAFGRYPSRRYSKST
jgi:hypothetical protein